MTTLLDYVRALEGLSSRERGERTADFLAYHGVPLQLHQYATGTNLIVPPNRRPYVAVSAHFDVVPGSPGANDNASAIAVLLGLVAAFQQQPTRNLGVGFFIFDEEENQLRGSQAYVEECGTQDLEGLINLEMLGQGEHLALWPLRPEERGRIWEIFEATCQAHTVRSERFHRQLLNTADHESFRMMGFGECFTLTAISDEDLAVAEHYYKALEFEVDQATLGEILRGAPLFHHYHRPTDLSEHLDESSLAQACLLIEATIRRLDAEQHR